MNRRLVILLIYLLPLPVIVASLFIGPSEISIFQGDPKITLEYGPGKFLT